ncbi:hypothetical protein [Erythrobacter sp. EC-HK427]|uniref:hypothetical protein n=1 Tax=Erythrobacter sp. EC-HK427 TaxID=2038396 RepID=UPI001254A3AC|nr:hypothetical protein [Erythrobacter sp. EC-HK427]VVT00443.1 hypothetical protein ERY430_40521 [Erythrobacter sp. EC-HK427]
MAHTFELISEFGDDVALRSVTVFGRQAEMGSGREAISIVLASGQTNDTGIFIVEVQSGPYQEVWAQLNGDPSQTVPVALDPTGSIPPNVILLMPKVTDGEVHGDAAVHGRDHDCGFALKSHEAIKQQLYNQIIIVEQPKVKKFLVNPPLTLTTAQQAGINSLEHKFQAAAKEAAASAAASSTGYAVEKAGVVAASPVSFRFGPVRDVPQHEAGLRGPVDAQSSGRGARPTGQIADGAASPASALARPGLTAVAHAHLADIAISEAEYAYVAEVGQIMASATDSIPARYVLDCDKPLDWDLSYEIAQACQPYLLHVITFVQEIVHAGYMEGGIVGSTTLLPCQEKKIATVTFRRDESNSRSEDVVAIDRLSNSLSRARDIGELQKATALEVTRGGSKSSTWGAGASVSIPLSGAMIGVSGGYSQSNASSFQNSSRNLATESSQRLLDSTTQAAESIRSQTVTVVHSVSQEESVTASTETVRNHNQTRSLELTSYSILSCFDIRQRVMAVREAFAIPLNITGWTEAKALRWEKALRNRLDDRSLLGGFDAIRRILDNYRDSDLPTGRYGDADITFFDGMLTVECDFREPSIDQFNLQSALGDAPWWMRTNAHYHGMLFGVWGKLQENRAQYWREKIAPGIAKEIAGQIRVFARLAGGGEVDLKLDATAATRLNNRGQITVAFRSQPNTPPIARSAIRYLVFKLVDDTGAVVEDVSTLLPAGSRLIVQAGQMGYETDFASGTLFNSRSIHNDLTGTDAVLVPTPLTTAEKSDPHKADRQIANRLMAELNSNTIAYHERVFDYMALEMPSQMRMILDRVMVPGTGSAPTVDLDPDSDIELGDDIGPDEESDALSIRTVSGDYIGAFDGCVAFFVAPGYSFSSERMNRQLLGDLPAGADLDLLSLYKPKKPVEAVRVTLPTGAIYTKATMGKCELREEIDYALNVNWGEPCEGGATEINPVSTESRRAEPADLTAKDFQQPIIALQNAPQAPEFSGSDALVSALSNPDIFRDMTGLSATQNAALQTYLKNASSADAARQDAVKVALARGMERQQKVKDFDQVESRIRKAEKAGLDADLLAKARSSNVRNLSDDPQLRALDDLIAQQNAISTPGLASIPSSDENGGPRLDVVGVSPFAEIQENLQQSIGTSGLGTPSRVVNIIFRAFIPSEAVRVKLMGIELDDPHGGDGRSFMLDDNGKHRGELVCDVAYGYNWNEPQLVTKRHWGQTTEYASSDASEVAGKPSWYLSLDSGSVPKRSEKLAETDDNLFADAAYSRLKTPLGSGIPQLLPSSAVLHLKMEGANPIAQDGVPDIFVPTISACIDVYLKDYDGELYYALKGSHDGFPAYELYIDGTAVYAHDPIEAGETPWSLAGTGCGETEVYRSWSKLGRK